MINQSKNRLFLTFSNNSNNNTQNSLSSFDENSPKTIGSLNTASQLSFIELSNSPIIEDKSSQIYQNSQGLMNRNMSQSSNLLRIQKHRLLVQNNVKELAKVINQNYEKKPNQLKPLEQNKNNSSPLSTLRQISFSKELTPLTYNAREKSNSLNKINMCKRYSMFQSENKNSTLDQSEYFHQTQNKPKLSFSEQFNNRNMSSISQTLLPSKIPELKYQSMVNIKIKDNQQSQQKTIKIEDYTNTNETKQGNIPQNQALPQNEMNPREIKLSKEFNISDKFQIFLQNFPSQFRKIVAKDESLLNALDFFRIESIKSQQTHIDLLVKFLVSCFKIFARDIKMQEQINEDNQDHEYLVNMSMKQSKNKIIINCTTNQLKLSQRISNEICETVFKILYRFKIPIVYFKEIKKIIEQQWQSQLNCVTFADKIGGYHNLIPIISNLSNQIIKAFQLTKQEQEYLELLNHDKLLEIIKEIIKKYLPEAQETNKNKSSNQQPVFEEYKEYVKKVKKIFKNKDLTGFFSKNSPFFLVKYIFWDVLFNSPEGYLFPEDIKLFLLSLFEKLRNENLNSFYWKEDMTSQQRMNIVYNTISSRQQLVQNLGPYFISQEKVFCKAILQFTIGQITASEFLNIIQEQISLNSNSCYLMAQINSAVQKALMTNNLITFSQLKILLQHKFFLINQNLNPTLFMNESFLQEFDIQIHSNFEQTMQAILRQLLSLINKQYKKQEYQHNQFISSQKLSYQDKIQIVTKYLLTQIFDTKCYSLFDIQEVLDLHQLEKNYLLKQNILNESKKMLYSIKLNIEQVNIIQQFIECSIFPSN